MTEGTDKFNDKHLLWWVFKAMDAYAPCVFDLVRDDEIWKLLDAPAWVFPAMKEKYEDFPKR